MKKYLFVYKLLHQKNFFEINFISHLKCCFVVDAKFAFPTLIIPRQSKLRRLSGSIFYMPSRFCSAKMYFSATD